MRSFIHNKEGAIILLMSQKNKCVQTTLIFVNANNQKFKYLAQVFDLSD